MKERKWKLTLARFIPRDHWLTTLLSRGSGRLWDNQKKKGLAWNHASSFQGIYHAICEPKPSWFSAFFTFFFSLLQRIFLEQMDSLFWQEMRSLPCQVMAVFKVSFFLRKAKSSPTDIGVSCFRGLRSYGGMKAWPKRHANCARAQLYHSGGKMWVYCGMINFILPHNRQP